MSRSYRPSWDAYFMAMAHMVAERSTCDRLLGGAVLVRDKRIIATGYNGSPSGMDHCNDIGHLMEEGHCIGTLHAEENTVLQAALFGVATQGTTIYTTYAPCYHCLKKLIACGITRIVAMQVYRDTKVRDVCLKAGIRFEIFNPDGAWLDHLSDMFKNLPREAQTEVKQAEKSKHTASLNAIPE